MNCKKPFMRGLIPCGCGQCLPCRVNKSTMWTGRLTLERDHCTTATFATLTLRDEEIQDVSGAAWQADRPVLGTLDPRELQNFLKRLRKNVAAQGMGPIRFFGVGEYGEDKGRPHYHIALFGFPFCSNGVTQKGLKYCCPPCNLVKTSWGKGHIELQQLSDGLAQYITKYITKKWTKEDQWTQDKLKGRHAEFVRMSLKPGIGAIAIKNLSTSTAASRQGKYLKMSSDVPAALRRGGRTLQLGKYLRRKFREALGRGPDTPRAELQRYLSDLHVQYQKDKQEALDKGVPAALIDPEIITRQKNAQKIKSFEQKQKIYSTRGKL